MSWNTAGLEASQELFELGGGWTGIELLMCVMLILFLIGFIIKMWDAGVVDE